MKLKKPIPPPKTLQEIKDALRAACDIGMWQTVWEISEQYVIDKTICLRCGKKTDRQRLTHLLRNQHGLRMCVGCAKEIGTR